MSEEYSKRGYLLEDFRLFHLSGSAGVKSELHYHDFCKLLLLVSGSGDYWVEGQRYSLRPGDVVMLGSGCVHRPEFEPGADYQRIIIYISPDFLRRSSTPDCDLLRCFSGEWGHVYRPEGKAGRRLMGLATELEQELSGQGYGRVILCSGMLLQLLVELGRQLQRLDADRPSPMTPKNRRVAEIVGYIDQHLTEDLTVDFLAERFFFSKFHMMRLFRSETGESVYTYIIRRRLMLAREQISAGMSATESCFRCGFGSYSSFTRAYGKYFGTTPTGRKLEALRQEAAVE